MKTTAIAHPNIALIKYWGKRDEGQALPYTDSVSITWEGLHTKTTLKTADAFSFVLNGQVAPSQAVDKVKAFLRFFTDSLETVAVESENTVPTGAGFASSASAFAALGVAANHFFKTGFSERELQTIVRRGSGSAIRSLYGGAVTFKRDGYAYPFEASLQNIALIPVLVDASMKTLSSREAMKRSVETSPFYTSFVTLSNADAPKMKAALEKGALDTIGALSETHAHALHATMDTAQPPFRYLNDASYRVMAFVRSLRSRGFKAYYTMDAGPNVKVLTPVFQADEIERLLLEAGFETLGILRPARKGARIIDDD
ncbi:MAG: diphosphomevalonate decarboxylase [Bacillota bacterium]